MIAPPGRLRSSPVDETRNQQFYMYLLDVTNRSKSERSAIEHQAGLIVNEKNKTPGTLNEKKGRVLRV